MSAPVDAHPSERRSYGQIIKSSALIGGSSLATLGVNIVRAKTMAIILGPAGVGMMGLYSSVFDVAQNLAGMGINSSGVRQMAEADASGDARRLSRTSAVLSRTSIGLGVLGGLVLLAACRPIALWTFGTTDPTWGVAALGLAVLLRSVSDGQGAALQGMRRVADVARKNVFSALGASGATILLVLTFGENGVVPSLVASAGVTLVVSWWYRRKIALPPTTRLSARDIYSEGSQLLWLGLAFMTSAVLGTGSAYLIRILVRTHAGVEAAGLYQSAWAIGGIYVAFILQSMGSDFYPRLTGAANDDATCNRLVNEQAEVGLLLAGPGVMATITCAPFIVSILYHSSFAGAAQPLRWICVGMALRVLAWPVGYILLAKNAQRLFYLAEGAAALVHVGLALLLVPRWGVNGAAMAFAGLYIWHGVLVYMLVKRLTGFAWSRINVIRMIVQGVLVAVVFAAGGLLPMEVAVPSGLAIATLNGLYSVRELAKLVTMEGAPRRLRVILQKFHLLPQPA
jgi:PST family polysaccharide transporter